MTIAEAKSLMEQAKFNSNPQTWLDLGCGSGIFTLALAELLPSGSHVVAVDQALQHLPKQINNGNTIQFKQADFVKDLDLHENINGILMANSMHYVENQQEFVMQLKELMGTHAQFILIEYDMIVPNPWVPFPIPIDQLPGLFDISYDEITKLGNRKSRYNGSMIYAVQIVF